jgi:hypothetical protein
MQFRQIVAIAAFENGRGNAALMILWKRSLDELGRA